MKKISKRILYARAISEFGNSLRYIALPLGILAIGNNPANLVRAELLETFGFLSSGILISFIIDRLPKIRALAIADALSLGVTGLIAFGLATKSLPVLFLGCFLITMFETFYSSSLGAITADLSEYSNAVESSRLRSIVSGFSRLQIYTLAAAILGTLFGSQAVRKIPFSALMLIDGATFFVSSVIIFQALKSVQFKSKTPSKDPITIGSHLRALWVGFYEGFKATFHQKNLRGFVFAQGIIGFAYGLVAGVTISHLKENINATDSRVSYSQANNRLWAFIGSWLQIKFTLPPRVILILGASIMTVGYFGMPIGSYFAFLLFYGIQQFGNALLTPTNKAMTMALADSSLRGRVSAFRGIVIDLAVLLGNTVSLVIVTTLGLRFTFVGAGIAMLCLVGFYAFRSLDNFGG